MSRIREWGTLPLPSALKGLDERSSLVDLLNLLALWGWTIKCVAHRPGTGILLQQGLHKVVCCLQIMHVQSA